MCLKNGAATRESLRQDRPGGLMSPAFHACGSTSPFASAQHCLRYCVSVCTIYFICDMIVVYHRSRLAADADPGISLIELMILIHVVYEIMLLWCCIADTRSPATRDSVAALEVCIRYGCV